MIEHLPPENGPTPATGGRRRVGRRAVLLLVVSVVAVVAAGGAWALRPPSHEFQADYGIGVTRPTGTRIWTVLEHGQDQESAVLHIRSIEPNIPQDGAAAHVEYVVCHLDPEVLAADGVNSVGYGMPDKTVHRACRRLEPVEGADFELGAVPGQELLVGVTTTRPGHTVIRSHRIEFTEGWRRGSADIHAEVDIRAR